MDLGCSLIAISQISAHQQHCCELKVKIIAGIRTNQLFVRYFGISDLKGILKSILLGLVII